ncbi:catechol 2,3-dioxygenase-like lactoylglutathione lyase family enzyme [Kitasatospora herbaricolor]|uniref:VOC family protein n=1 Tax=Kitasatospora herbaricolor TaxID=68217 RepID=UPI00174C3FD8|nr:extradiol dioxygenase [Kitasatospora herbaricolor]MDQ0312858.1 catechol 2,3-dioxygenase-like lactoylglutathione lyase family enzyme [Kitasatospora herbaricolor]
MINGAHIVVHSRDAEADRAFFRNVLEYPHVDAGGGWLIFKLPPAEVAVHPTTGPEGQELFLMCDDLEATMRTLTAKGVEFTQPVTEQRWGRLTRLRLPGGGEVGIYEPRHRRATDL